MKKLIAFSLFLAMAVGTALSANLTGQQEQEVVAKINKAAAGIKTMSCSFTQTKHLKMLSDKMVSKGHLYYRQSDKLRWEYTSPYQYLFIFNGTKVFVGNKSRRDVIDTNTNKVFKEIARIMMNTVTGKALSDTNDFAVEIASEGTDWVVTMTPKKKDLKQMFSRVVLTFAKSNLLISQVNIFEKNGDKTNIQLTDVSYNAAVNEALFAIP